METPRRVLAISSGGGHWVQLLRLRPALDRHDITWVTVNEASRQDLPADADLRIVRDATRWDRLALVIVTAQLCVLLLRIRPDVIVTTGAAPGFLALRLGGLLGAATLWVDSIANVEQLSMSGRRAVASADECLTQWRHLAASEGPSYHGAVL